MDIQVGTTIGDYQVTAILGAGGMGKVYKVRNLISDRVEAMKVLLPDLMNAPELVDRFLREIKVQATLEHPNIAALHTAVRVDNQLLMLMEFVEGATIEQKLHDHPLPVADAVNYMSQMLLALDYAHSRGVVHRDIKPANMMLTPGGVIKLMDFGIAKAASDRRLTMTGTTMGSLYYMSPEQIQGATNLDGRADLYSAGVSLYEMVTGRHPFDGDSQFAIMSAHLAGNPVPPVRLDSSLPQALNDAILVAVAKDPNSRFQTAGAFRNALQMVALKAAAASVTWTPVSIPTPPRPVGPPPVGPARSKRGLWMGVGALATVAAIVAAIELRPSQGTDAAGNQRNVPISSNPQQQPGHQPAVTPPQQQPPGEVPQQQPAAGGIQPPNVTPRNPGNPGGSIARVPQGSPPQQPAQQNPVQGVGPGQQPGGQQPQQPVTPVNPPPQVQQGSSQAELQAVREPLAMLTVRANGIRSTLNDLKRSQAAMGVGLGSKFQGPLDLMNSYLQGANDALNAGEAATAKTFMDKAEKQVEILEQLLNR